MNVTASGSTGIAVMTCVAGSVGVGVGGVVGVGVEVGVGLVGPSLLVPPPLQAPSRRQPTTAKEQVNAKRGRRRIPVRPHSMVATPRVSGSTLIATS